MCCTECDFKCMLGLHGWGIDSAAVSGSVQKPHVEQRPATVLLYNLGIYVWRV